MQTAVEPGGRVREPLRRRAVVASVSGTLLLAGAIAVVRHDGFPARRFIAAHARRWLVHEPTGNLALADEVSGRVVARVASDRPNHLLDTAQGSVGAFLLDRSTSQAMRIDERGLRLEQPRSLPGLSADQPLSAVSVTPDGLVAVSGGPGTLSILPLNGVARSQPVAAASHPALITPAGRVWQLDSTDGHARLVDPSGTLVVLDDSSGDADFTSVGNDVVVIERRTGEVDWFPGRQVAGLAGLVDTSDAVLQEPGPAAPCAWIGSGDELICVRADRVAQRLRLGDELPFQFHRGDRLAISAAVGVILESSGTVFSVDLASGVMRRVAFSWSSTDHRQLTSTDDGIWIDDPLGAGAALVTSGGVTTFDKLDSRAPLFGQDGLPLEVGGRTNRPDTVEADPAPDVPAPTDLIARAPDNDGIAEAPVANPDIVSGLADDAVLIAVTANDYDPDGDPIAVTKVTASSHGSLTIASPGQIEYRPNPGYSGPDSFTYTVADPTGNESRAAVSIEVLAPNSPDTAPIAAADFRQTAGIRPLMIDALANDVDADRDLLRLTNLGALPPTMGTVKLVVRSDGREVVVFTPGPDAAGRTVSFTYQAIDTHGRVSAPARMTIEVAAVGAPNRPPLAQPDAVQARAGRSVLIPVLTNDVDPDNDALSITSASVDDPASGTVVVDGSQLRFTSAPTASGDVIVRYAISDGNPGESSAAVLVRVIDLAAPDVAPIARPDLRVTPGDAIIFDPTTNDIDPDGDPLLISKFDQPIAGGTVTRVGPSTLQVTPAGGFAGTLSFPYVVTDGALITGQNPASSEPAARALLARQTTR